MCGIAGLLALQARAPGVGVDTARRMGDVMLHRGPDGRGEWGDGVVALAHRRLKIIDLSERAAQPMATSDGRYVIVFNGEIYNYAEIRERLRSRGVTFQSESDTEVLVQAFAAYGREALPMLNGIFAFAVWDTRERTLLLARDPIGVKPLYYAHDGDRLVFASEIKAVLAAGFPAEVRRAAIGEYLLYGSVAGEATLLRGVERLRPGEWLEARPGRALRLGRYHDPLEIADGARGRQAARSTLAKLKLAVERQMVSDVPVGSMCSGGLDSSVITALSAKLHPGISTFCIKIGTPRFDESSFGRLVSQHCRTTHHELESTADDVGALLPTLVWLHDEPLAHPNSVPIFQISRLAKQSVTVLLSGEGSDEIFAGYPSYRRYLWLRRLRAVVPGRAAAFAGLFAPRGRLSVTQIVSAMSASDPAEMLLGLSAKTAVETLRAVAPDLDFGADTRRELARSALAAAGHDAINGALLYDQATHLQTLLDRQDKMCMGASIESRVPFLDVELVRHANSLRGALKLRRGVEKHVLRRATGHLLPDSIGKRPKFAFGLPLGAWLSRSSRLSERLGALQDGELVRAGAVSRAGIEKLLAGLRDNQCKSFDLLWYLLNLEDWWALFVTRKLEPSLRELPAYG